MNFIGVEQLTQFFLQLEGPYKWYVMVGIAVGITAVVTHFIFRTLKWFLLIAALGVILFYLWSQLYKEVDSTWKTNVDKEQIQRSYDIIQDLKPTPSP